MNNPAVADTTARHESPVGLGPVPAARRSELESRHAPYFVQKVQVGRDLVGRSRFDVLGEICAGRRVLHVGCVDWPITDVRSSLHVQLDAVCSQLDGFDIHAEAFDALRPHVRGRFFSQWSEVTDAYDLVLAPEVMEHVGDVEGFLRQLSEVRAPGIVLSVPDAFQCMRAHFDFLDETETFIEVVHPDHNCWYTPYTLSNVLRKYTDWTLQGLWFFNRISILAILTKGAAAIPR